MLAQGSARPNLNWEFIVLDTDGVNAFAAPGGIVHITRGALGLIKSEAELAGVLGHEIAHVAQKHTVNSIEQSRKVKLGTDVAAGSREYFGALADYTYDNIVEKGFDRGDENDADEKGIRLANKVGYNPIGLGVFLTKLMERNKGNADHNGLFASHPDTQARVDRLGNQITDRETGRDCHGDGALQLYITFDAKPLAEIAAVAAGTQGRGRRRLQNEEKKTEEKKEEPKRKGFGLLGGEFEQGQAG